MTTTVVTATRRNGASSPIHYSNVELKSVDAEGNALVVTTTAETGSEISAWEIVDFCVQIGGSYYLLVRKIRDDMITFVAFVTDRCGKYTGLHIGKLMSHNTSRHLPSAYHIQWMTRVAGEAAHTV